MEQEDCIHALLPLWSCVGLSQLPAQVLNWSPKRDRCSQLCHHSLDQQLSPGSGWDRTQDSHLHCTTVTPKSCQAAKEIRRQKGSHTTPQLHTYLRAECCLLMEIASHKFTIFPGGYFTPGGGTSNQNEEQVACGRLQWTIPCLPRPPTPPCLIPSLPTRTDAFCCP